MTEFDPSTVKSENLSESFSFAWQGIVHTFLRERNFKIHVAAAIIAAGAGIALRIEAIALLMVMFAVFLVLCMELVNTAVEALADLFCGARRHPLAKIAKDAAAGAVLLASVQAVIVGAVVFIPPLRAIWTQQ